MVDTQVTAGEVLLDVFIYVGVPALMIGAGLWFLVVRPLLSSTWRAKRPHAFRLMQVSTIAAPLLVSLVVIAVAISRPPSASHDVLRVGPSSIDTK